MTPRAGIWSRPPAMFAAFVAVSLALLLAIYGVANQFLPVFSINMVLAGYAVVALLSWCFGVWREQSGLWLKIASAAVCAILPPASLIGFVVTLCSIGPECMPS